MISYSSSTVFMISSPSLYHLTCGFVPEAFIESVIGSSACAIISLARSDFNVGFIC
jgi:hypothetical protein